MTNVNLDNIKANEVKTEGLVTETDRKALDALTDKTTLKNEFNAVKIDGASIKDVVTAIGNSGESFSRGGVYNNYLETKGVKVKVDGVEKTIKIQPKSEALVLIQAFLAANTQDIGTWGLDGWMGGDTQGAAYRFTHPSETTTTETTEVSDKLKLNSLTIGKIIDDLNGINQGVLEDDIKTAATTNADIITKFQRAKTNGVFPDGKMPTLKEPTEDEVSMIKSSQKVNLTTRKLYDGSGILQAKKDYSLDLTKFVTTASSTEATVRPTDLVQELYTEINKMYKDQAEVTQNSTRKTIEKQYAAILTTTITPNAKSLAINLLIAQFTPLKTEATKLGLTTSLAAINADITAYKAMSNSLTGSSYLNAWNAIEKTTTKSGEISEARQTYLTGELKEINRIKSGLTGVELTKATERLTNIPLEQTYLKWALKDLAASKEVTNYMSNKQWLLLSSAKEVFKKTLTTAHKNAYVGFGKTKEYDAIVKLAS